jgi:arylsulfatase A-like enzyme
MQVRPAFWARLLCLLLAAVALAAPGEAAPRPPNIVLILVDDLGWLDVSLHGAREIQTPNIDALAASGMRMTQAYVTAPFCAPSRAGLLTGRYQQRFGFEYNPESGLGEGRAPPGLRTSERTVGDVLGAAGYDTAVVGKWHLGFHARFLPNQRGFRRFFGFLGSTHPYLEPGQYGALWRDGAKTDESEFLTEAFAREANAFIEEPRSRPFFLYLPFNAVHLPLEAPERYRQRFGFVPHPERRTYLAMVSALDDAVGSVLETLTRTGQAGETLVVFASDNGGSLENHARNAPLRGGKGTMWEGGIRVPLFVRWPGKLPPGSTYAAPVSALDLLPTFAAAAGLPAPVDPRAWDGVDLAPYWQGSVEGRPHPQLYWRAGRDSAVRDGDLKLVRHAKRVELFDLASDSGERRDLAAARPQDVARLRGLYDDWEDGVEPPAWKRAKQPFRRWRDE